MSIVHSRIEDKNIKTLDQLARTRGATRSSLIREAVEMYVASYIGEPNINDVEKRVRDLESNFNELKAKLKNKGIIDGL